jgi:hypothetical protein
MEKGRGVGFCIALRRVMKNKDEIIKNGKAV